MPGRAAAMVELNLLPGSLFFFCLMFEILISCLVKRVNFENVSGILDGGVRYQSPWFPYTVKVFLYNQLNNKTDLVSDLFGRRRF